MRRCRRLRWCRNKDSPDANLPLQCCHPERMRGIPFLEGDNERRLAFATRPLSIGELPDWPQPRSRDKGSFASLSMTGPCRHTNLSGLRRPRLCQDSLSLASTLQYSQGLLQFILGVGGRHDRADARFSFGHRWERNAGPQNTFFEELAGEVHREFAVTDDDWSDGCLT